MICLIALVVFGILGIFSARYRTVAKEAFDCVFRRVTFRKCTSGLDSRLRSQIAGSLMRRSPGAAGFVYRRFEILSWIFTAVMVWSLVVSAVSVYNYARYGNCYGTTGDDGFCIFDPYGNTKFSACTQQTNYSGNLTMPGEGTSPSIGSKDAPVLMIEFGCYVCQYTRKAEATVRQVLQLYPDAVRYVYRDFPLVQHANASLPAEAARCAEDQGRFWEYHKLLFDEQNLTDHNATIYRIASGLGLNMSLFSDCIASGRHLPDVTADFEVGLKAGVYGTPTFFINNNTLVGPRPLDSFRKIIDKELAKVKSVQS